MDGGRPRLEGPRATAPGPKLNVYGVLFFLVEPWSLNGAPWGLGARLDL